MSLKEKVIEGLRDGNYEEIIKLAANRRGVFSILISLTYDKGDLICWRAIEVIGKITQSILNNKPEVVSHIIHRMLWAMSDESGGIGWSSPEILCEIILNNPEQFRHLIPIVISSHDEEMFRPGVLRAIGRIGGVRPDLVQQSIPVVLNYLDYPDPSVRGNAAWSAGEIKVKEALSRLERMVDDNSRFMIYEHGRLSERAVGDAAKEAIAKIRIGR